MIGKENLLQITITELASMHVLEAKDNFGCIKSHIYTRMKRVRINFLLSSFRFLSVPLNFIPAKLTSLTEYAVLREMIVQVTAVHEVEDEAEFVGGVKCIGHADDEWAILAGGDEVQHETLVYC